MFGALISNLEPILRLGQPYYEYQASKDLLHKKLVLDKFRCRCVLVWISAKNVSKTYPIIITATNQYMKVGFLESWCDFRSYMVNLLSSVGLPPMCMFNVPKLHNHSTLMVITSVLLWSMTNHFGCVAPWTKDTIQDPKIHIRIRFGYVLDMILRKCVRSCLVIKITWFVQKCDLRAPCMPIDAPTYAQ